MKSRKTPYLLLTIALGIFAISGIASAETGCAFEPFTTTITQGESATIAVIVTLPDPAASYELNLGSLPSSVQGGFSPSGNAGTGTARKSALLIQSNPDAQTGSFMIPVLCRISAGSKVSESINQFNLVINNGAKIVSSVSQSAEQSSLPTISQTVSSGPKALVTGSDLKMAFSHSNNSNIVPLAASATSTKTVPTAPDIAAKGIIVSSLSKGSRGAQVILLQQILRRLNFFPKDMEPTGYFGTVTESAVREFQKNKNLEAVGQVGPRTKKALNGLTQ